MMHEHAVHCLAFSRDSELLASGSSKGEVKVWKVRTGRCLRKFPSAHTGAINSLQFARDGTQLMSEDDSRLEYFHSEAEWKIYPCLYLGLVLWTTLPASMVSRVVLLPLSLPQISSQFHLYLGRTIKEYRGHKSYVNSAIFSVDGSRVITASADGTVKTWDARNADCVATFKADVVHCKFLLYSG